MKKKEVELKIKSAKFELSEQRTIAKVVQEGKVLAEIIICSDGLFIEQNRADFVK